MDARGAAGCVRGLGQPPHLRDGRWARWPRTAPPRSSATAAAPGSDGASMRWPSGLAEPSSSSTSAAISTSSRSRRARDGAPTSTSTPASPRSGTPTAAARGSEGHDTYFTVGENIGTADVPDPDRWPRLAAAAAAGDARRLAGAPARAGGRFTTVATWRSPLGDALATGGHRIRRQAPPVAALIDLPRRSSQEFEIALQIHPGDAADRAALEAGGWRLADPRRGRRRPAGLSRLRPGLRPLSSPSPIRSTSTPPAAGSATAPSATSPAAARRSSRTPASPGATRSARGC